jgi:phosphodiesterase/alkaline phosphatase D-like protein
VLAAAALLLVPQGASAAKGFNLGVAASDVTAKSAILWARSSRTGRVLLQVKRHGGFGGCPLARTGGAGIRALVRATKGHNLTVQKRIGGLRPNTRYRYRFCRRGGARSEIGHFKTAPAPNSRRTIRFAWSGDQDAQPAAGQHRPFWNDFGVLSRMRAEHNDFNVILGDWIYSDTEVPVAVPHAISIKQKWQKYRMNLAQKPLQALRAAGAVYNQWDDHEFINDFSRHESKADLGISISPEKLYRNGVHAFRDYAPVTYSKKLGIYRSVRWGKNLEVFFPDERSFRSAKADANGVCDNPPGSGNPDVAPTAPQDPTRNLFGSTVLPQLLTPPPAGCLSAINDPNRTMLGARQLHTLERAVSHSKATFKVIMNEVPIQQFYALPYDRWEGYAHERQALLTYLKNKARNVVFLTTDVHANLVNDARLKTLEPGGPVDSGIMDITTGPIATKPFEQEIDDVGGAGSGNLVASLFFKAPPATPPAFGGPGMSCAAIDVFSYGEVTVTPKKLTVQLKDINGGPVHEGTNGTGSACPNNSTIVIPKS